MAQIEAIVANPVGLHARPATLCVKEAQRFVSDITLLCKGKKANAKSLFSVLALGAVFGDTVEICAEGEDAAEAAEALSARISDTYEAF